MWNERNVSGSSVQCILLRVCQRELEVPYFSESYTCIRATARGIDFNGVWRTTFSEVKDDLAPEEEDLSGTINEKLHLDGERRSGAE